MKTVLSVLLVVACPSLFAQEIRLAGLDYFAYPKATVSDGSGNYQSSFQEFGAFAAYPRQSKNKKTILINGLQYALVDVSVSNKAQVVTNHRSFQAIAYSLSILHTLTEQWKIGGMLTPSLASDFKAKLSGTDFFIQGSLIGIRKLSHSSSVGAGITYTIKLGSPLWLPVLSFRQYKGRHKLNILLPSLAEYAYRLDAADKLSAGLRIGLNGANFHVSGNRINPNIDINKLRYSRINVGAVVSYKISRMIRLEVIGGLSTARKYEFLDGKEHTYSFNTNDVGFFNVGLALVPPISDDN